MVTIPPFNGIKFRKFRIERIRLGGSTPSRRNLLRINVQPHNVPEHTGQVPLHSSPAYDTSYTTASFHVSPFASTVRVPRWKATNSPADTCQ